MDLQGRLIFSDKLLTDLTNPEHRRYPRRISNAHFQESTECASMQRPPPQPKVPYERRTRTIAALCGADRCRQHLTANRGRPFRGGGEVRRGKRSPNLR